MGYSDLNLEEKNGELRAEFAAWNLDPFEIVSPKPDDLARENRQLEMLLDWVAAYRRYPSREVLKGKGYAFPPVEPGYGPEEDWQLFEQWVKGEAVGWRSDDVPALRMPDPAEMTDDEVARRLRAVKEELAQRSVMVELRAGVPDRLVYAYLRETLRQKVFPLTGGSGVLVLDGCSGYCPGCFQRPWCTVGQDLDWVEDEEAGGMALPPEVRPYLPGGGAGP